MPSFMLALHKTNLMHIDDENFYEQVLKTKTVCVVVGVSLDRWEIGVTEA